MQRQQDIQHLKIRYLNNVFQTITEDQDVFERITQQNIIDDILYVETHLLGT